MKIQKKRLIAVLVLLQILTCTSTVADGMLTKSESSFNIHAKIGTSLFFGRYEQDNSKENGAEPIEWIILAKENDKALVISKYALDCHHYHTSNDITWGNSELLKWLNKGFLYVAFNEEEQQIIQYTKVKADKNPKYKTDSGGERTDKIFLLSITEAEQYFSSDSDRRCKPTEYAVQKGCNINQNNENCWWWLRTPGSYSGRAADVLAVGSINYGGYYINCEEGGVRPAMWIDLGLYGEMG